MPGPNVVLIVADELMAAALPCYGGGRAGTPGLDRLAREGTVFDRAYCNAPVCTPSRYSMLSGRRPWSIGAYHNQSPTPAEHPSLAALLSARGYDTVGIGKMHFKGSEQLWGYRSRPYGDFGGLSHQPDPIGSAPRLSFVADAGPADIADDDQHDVIVGRLAADYLEQHDHGTPFFLHLSFNFPHYPLRPPRRLFDAYFPEKADLPRLPEAPAGEHAWMRERRAVYRDLIGDGSFSDDQIRRARAAYYACIALVDEQVQLVLDRLQALGLADDTVVIFTADHGEMLGEYGTWEKNCFYEPAVRVPLIVRVPGAVPGRVDGIVELVDLVPTVLELTGDGAVNHDRFDGESLAPLLGLPGRANPRDRTKDLAISELAPTYVTGLARMVCRDRWKLIAYDDGTFSLYDLAADPDELSDLGMQPPPEAPLADLWRLAECDFARVRRESEAAHLAVHPSYGDQPPNQFRSGDGTLSDAETFYQVRSWIPERTGASKIKKRRPLPDEGEVTE